MKNYLAPNSFKDFSVPALLLLFSANTSGTDCQFEVRNQWNSGFTASVSITNNSAELIDGWSVTLAFPDGATMGSPWNGSLTSTEPYTVENANYNGKITAGSSKSFGFNGNKANTGVDVMPPTLGGICGVSVNSTLPEITINVSDTEGSLPLSVDFSAVSDSSEDLTYEWDFGDSNQASGKDVEHTYNQIGNFQASLTFSDGTNQTTLTQNIVATEPQPEDAQCQFIVKNEWGSGFTGAVEISNDSAYTIRGWQVDMLFPDLTELSGSWNATHSGSNPYQFNNASYNANIAAGESVEFGFNAQKAIDGGDVSVPSLGGICRSSQTNLPPIAVISSANTRGNAPFNLSLSAAESSDPEGDTLSYTWFLGNEQISQEVNLEYIFEEPGSYTVALEVNDGEAFSDRADIEIIVDEPDGDGGDNQQGTWSLNAESSSLFFVSTKKTHVMEVHTFNSLSGAIDEQGVGTLTIHLDSVSTGISLRNERMREHLFETSNHPVTNVTLPVDMDLISSLENGQSHTLEVSPLIELHGLSLPVSAKARITKISANSLLVVSAEPVVIDALEFGFESGINTLMSLASLDMISLAVPVNFTLLFEQQ